MVEIIETNLSYDNNGQLQDHQSRIVEANSWKEYVSIYENYDGNYVDKFKVKTQLLGYSIPRMVKIMNLKYNDFHLSCDLILWNGQNEGKLAYLIAR